MNTLRNVVFSTKKADPWRRTGYSLVGVTPDAEAEGQPSIQFARSLRNVGQGDD